MKVYVLTICTIRELSLHEIWTFLWHTKNTWTKIFGRCYYFKHFSYAGILEFHCVFLWSCELCSNFDDCVCVLVCWVSDLFPVSPFRGTRSTAPSSTWRQCCRSSSVVTPWSRNRSATPHATSRCTQTPWPCWSESRYKSGLEMFSFNWDTGVLEMHNFYQTQRHISMQPTSLFRIGSKAEHLKFSERQH